MSDRRRADRPRLANPDLAARELTFTRVLRAPRHNVWRCWTEPALIVRWFTPPWQTVAAEMDVRPGGSSLIVMRGPEGQEMPNHGVYLEALAVSL